MHPYDYLAWSINQKHTEFLKQADEYRKLAIALRTEKPALNGIAKFLGLVGKELGRVGFSLEIRYSGQPEPRPTLNQTSGMSGCP